MRALIEHLRRTTAKVWDPAARATCYDCGRFMEWTNRELRNQKAMCSACMRREMAREMPCRVQVD